MKIENGGFTDIKKSVNPPFFVCVNIDKKEPENL